MPYKKIEILKVLLLEHTHLEAQLDTENLQKDHRRALLNHNRLEADLNRNPDQGPLQLLKRMQTADVLNITDRQAVTGMKLLSLLPTVTTINTGNLNRLHLALQLHAHIIIILLQHLPLNMHKHPLLTLLQHLHSILQLQLRICHQFSPNTLPLPLNQHIHLHHSQCTLLLSHPHSMHQLLTLHHQLLLHIALHH